MKHPLALILTLLAAQAQAWEASTDGALCVLSHDGALLDIRLTYDPGLPRYTITLTRDGTPWPEAPVFALRFDGPRPNLITTDRHVTDGTTLSVADRGFGNVLDGLQFNETATALTGGAAVDFSLAGAAPAVLDFRACVLVPSA